MIFKKYTGVDRYYFCSNS